MIRRSFALLICNLSGLLIGNGAGFFCVVLMGLHASMQPTLSNHFSALFIVISMLTCLLSYNTELAQLKLLFGGLLGLAGALLLARVILLITQKYTYMLTSHPTPGQAACLLLLPLLAILTGLLAGWLTHKITNVKFSHKAQPSRPMTWNNLPLYLFTGCMTSVFTICLTGVFNSFYLAPESVLFHPNNEIELFSSARGLQLAYFRGIMLGLMLGMVGQVAGYGIDYFGFKSLSTWDTRAGILAAVMGGILSTTIVLPEYY